MSQQSLKLLVEEPTFEYDILHEEKNPHTPSAMYIRGPFLMAEQKNRNGRIYTLNEMFTDVERYKTEMIKPKRSLGELNHPASVEINPERACQLTTELVQEKNVWVGKAKILSNPIGQIVRSLLMDGVKLGVSSRALGKLIPGSGDSHLVQGFHLICCDVVHDPSVNVAGGPQAFVNGILESKSWIVNRDGSIAESYEAFERGLSSLPRRSNDREDKLRSSVLAFLEKLKNGGKS